MPHIHTPIEELGKITKPQLAALKKLGIITVKDLLLHLPYRFLDFSKTSKISELKPGENVSIKVTVKSISSRFSFRGRLSLAEAVVSDDTGSIKVVWFNQAYLAKSLSPNEELFLAGVPEFYKGSLQLNNPLYEKASDFPIHTSRLVPVYHLKNGIYPKTFRNLVKTALPSTTDLQDELPAQIVSGQSLLSLKSTILYSHFPENEQQITEAKKRLAFEEIFYSQLAAQKTKLALLNKPSFQIPFNQNLIKKFVESLPFKLTVEQKMASWEILQDLEKPNPMNRLLEGDVGSGKTLVAFIAALQTVTQGLQVAILAPTEILARQHFETANKFLKTKSYKLKAKISLFTNTFAKIDNEDVQKKSLLKLITEGMPGIYIGTHALLQKKINFKNLALVIIDEQHRFGVEQRSELVQKHEKIPHLLSLSATPIPRTLKLAFFGELEISQIKTKPADRKPIVTKLIDSENRTKAYKFIQEQISSGRQTFVITPLIEENDKLGVKSAKTEALSLTKIFPKLKIGLLHGKMKGSDKEAAMADFLANKTQILVSTSVVEVGVDVPNASVMVIEGAERFGLAQLHQFRGRVGRAQHQSYCFLFTQKENQETLTRLQSFTKTSNGFELAELDLKQRGFGDVYGAQQSGWNYKYFDLSYTSLIEPARQEAKKILAANPDLSSFPELQNKIKDRVIHFE